VPCIVAVDIPIGFPTTSVTGGCAVEREARAALGRHRASSVFPRPSRAALKGNTFEKAKKLEYENSDPKKTINKQTYNLLCKMREIDEIARQYAGRLLECHPEVTFWAMNNCEAMCFKKKRARGGEERRKHLQMHGYSERFLTTRIGSAKKHAPDDLLDACAAAWTAERICKGSACKFPTISEPLDATGLEMAIWA